MASTTAVELSLMKEAAVPALIAVLRTSRGVLLLSKPYKTAVSKASPHPNENLPPCEAGIEYSSFFSMYFAPFSPSFSNILTVAVGIFFPKIALYSSSLGKR